MFRLFAISLGLLSLACHVSSGYQDTTYLSVSINLTTVTQSGGPVGPGNVPAPKVEQMNNRKLLKRLARDAMQLGEWSSDSFPATARLAVQMPSLNCVVMDGSKVLVNVSELLGLEVSDNGLDKIVWGATDDSGAPSPVYRMLMIGGLSYDNSEIFPQVEPFQFTSQGVMGVVRRRMTRGKSLILMTSQVAGKGKDAAGRPFIVSGTISMWGLEKWRPN